MPLDNHRRKKIYKPMILNFIQTSFFKDWLSFFRLNILIFLYCRWDFCFSRGSVIEHLDGHTDIIHKQLNGDWLPWSAFKFLNILVSLLSKLSLGGFLLHCAPLAGVWDEEIYFYGVIGGGKMMEHMVASPIFYSYRQVILIYLD